MNRIERTFYELRRGGGKALIIYLTAGYPDLDTTVELARALPDAGADIIELGIPFSDPLADGPVIQEASRKALENGTTPGKIFGAVKRIRKNSGVPLAFMTYYNPVYAPGEEKFAGRMEECGADGLIVPDLPPEEAGGLKDACERRGISLVFLAASNTTPERLKLVADMSSGFIYCLSRLGITGGRKDLAPGQEGFTGRLRRLTDTPLAVGFGISRPEHVKAVNSFADGAIVGSALIEEISKSPPKDIVKRASAFVSRLKKA